MQYPVGKADGYFVPGWSVFVTPLGTARYRRAVPAPNACAVWSIFPTHDHSLGIGGQCPHPMRAPCGQYYPPMIIRSVSAGSARGQFVHRWCVFVTHDHSLGIVPCMSLRGRKAAAAIRIPTPLPLGEVPPQGAERALSVSFADSTPIGGAFGETDCHARKANRLAMTFYSTMPCRLCYKSVRLPKQ